MKNPLHLLFLFFLSTTTCFFQPVLAAENLAEITPLLQDDDECEFEVIIHEQTCDFIFLRAFTPSPPFPIVTWTVNGESVFSLPGSILQYQFDGSGSYTFCATQNNTSCTDCITVEVVACSDSCGDFSFEFVNEDDPASIFVAWFAPIFDGDLSEGTVFWDFDAGSSPVITNDSLVGYQYGPGTYNICATYSTATCSSTYCDTVVIGGGASAVYGCTDSLALNYNPAATYDDGSCTYDEPICSLTFLAIADSTQDGVLIIVPFASYDSVPGAGYEDANWLLWDFGDGNVSIEPYPIHTYEGNGPYELCLTVGFGSPAVSQCIATFCLEVDESLLGRETGFSINVVAPQSLSTSANQLTEGLRIFPNPASEALNVAFTRMQAAPMLIRIFDLSGKMLYSENYSASSGDNLVQLPVSKWLPGMYMLQLSGENEQQTLRFVISK